MNFGQRERRQREAYALTMGTATGSGQGGPSSLSRDSLPEGEPLAPTRVLLIEDEPGIVDFVRRGLEAEGFVVEQCLRVD